MDAVFLPTSRVTHAHGYRSTITSISCIVSSKTKSPSHGKRCGKEDVCDSTLQEHHDDMCRWEGAYTSKIFAQSDQSSTSEDSSSPYNAWHSLRDLNLYGCEMDSATSQSDWVHDADLHMATKTQVEDKYGNVYISGGLSETLSTRPATLTVTYKSCPVDMWCRNITTNVIHKYLDNYQDVQCLMTRAWCRRHDPSLTCVHAMSMHSLTSMP